MSGVTTGVSGAPARVARRVREYLVAYYAHMLEYRAEIALWMLSGLLPFILMGVWMKAAGDGRFVLDSLQFARYFTAVFLVRQATVVWVIWEFEGDVVQGKLSPFLLQPIDPVWRYIARHVSERAARLPFLVALLALFFIWRRDVFWLPSLKTAALSLVAVTLAFALRFAVQYSFAMLTFWTERASSVQRFWWLLYMLLSGLMAPLDVYPPEVARIARWTPFPWMVDWPARLLVGLPVDAPAGLAMLTAWLLVFIVINRLLWRAGLRHYSAMGA